jgi:hypothetical protein
VLCGHSDFPPRHTANSEAVRKEAVHTLNEGNFPAFAARDNLIRNVCNWILHGQNRIVGHGR